jgi:hypothetical protein
MGDMNRDPDLDRTPADPGSDLAETVKARGDDTDAAGTADKTSPLEPTGVEDGVGGTAGMVKNQDDTAQ